MKGYLDNPTATKETLMDDGWLKTGDIGHYDEDGHVFITDRLKELIKVQGFPVAPAELEGVSEIFSDFLDKYGCVFLVADHTRASLDRRRRSNRSKA